MGNVIIYMSSFLFMVTSHIRLTFFSPFLISIALCNRNENYTFSFKIFKISFNRISSYIYLEIFLVLSISQHSWSFSGRNFLKKTFTVFLVEVNKIRWK
jgi:hypothetical protein